MQKYRARTVTGVIVTVILLPGRLIPSNKIKGDVRHLHVIDISLKKKKKNV